LSVYECAVSVGRVRGWWVEEGKEGEVGKKRGEGVYPMDFYEAGSRWSVARLKASFE